MSDTIISVDVVYESIAQPTIIEVFMGGAPGPKGDTGEPGLAVVYIGQFPPSNPNPGELWWDSFDTLELYVWYDDGTSHQWVVANTAQGGGGGGSVQVHPLTLDAGTY